MSGVRGPPEAAQNTEHCRKAVAEPTRAERFIATPALLLLAESPEARLKGNAIVFEWPAIPVIGWIHPGLLRPRPQPDRVKPDSDPGVRPSSDRPDAADCPARAAMMAGRYAHA